MGNMANAYLRFSIDNQKVTSYGCNTSDARRTMKELEGYVKTFEDHEFILPSDCISYWSALSHIKAG